MTTGKSYKYVDHQLQFWGVDGEENAFPQVIT